MNKMIIFIRQQNDFHIKFHNEYRTYIYFSYILRH